MRQIRRDVATRVLEWAKAQNRGWAWELGAEMTVSRLLRGGNISPNPVPASRRSFWQHPRILRLGRILSRWRRW